MAGNSSTIFVEALLEDPGIDVRSIRSVISHLRTLGFINEIVYSQMNTALSQATDVVRYDNAETIEMARERILPSEY
jgi:hypothetical protein